MNKSHRTTLGIPYWNADGTAVHFLDDEGFVGIGSKSLDRLQYMPISTGITENILRFEKGFEACVVIKPGKMLFTSLAGTLHRLEKINGQWGETFVGNVNWDACCLAYAPEHDHVAIMSPHELVIFSAADTTRMVIVKFEDGHWAPYFCTDPQVAVRDILETVAARWAIEEHFHDVSDEHRRKICAGNAERLYKLAS